GGGRQRAGRRAGRRVPHPSPLAGGLVLIPRALLAPHLATLLVDEHRRHRTPMLEALSREAERFRAERPAAAVVMSTRWRSTGPFQVDVGRLHRTLTDYQGFGVEVRYDCPGHPALARALVD